MREGEKDNYFLVNRHSRKNELPKEQKRRGAKAPLVKPKPSPFNHRTSKKSAHFCDSVFSWIELKETKRLVLFHNICGQMPIF